MSHYQSVGELGNLQPIIACHVTSPIYRSNVLQPPNPGMPCDSPNQQGTHAMLHNQNVRHVNLPNQTAIFDAICHHLSD